MLSSYPHVTSTNITKPSYGFSSFKRSANSNSDDVTISESSLAPPQYQPIRESDKVDRRMSERGCVLNDCDEDLQITSESVNMDIESIDEENKKGILHQQV